MRLRTLFLAGTIAAFALPAFADTTLLNVSYDPTRELYKDFNAAFAEHYKAETGETVTVRMSHGGSGKQARSVIDGLEADVVTLALAADIDEIAKSTGKIPTDWQGKFENNSSPYTSTIVFLVREGNPDNIKDWGDLVRDGVEVITPNPKTSGGARWNYLAAWNWAQEQYKDEAKVRDYMVDLFKHVPVLDTGARGSTTTFTQRGLGDVLITWENEAYLSLDEFGEDKFDIVVPSVSIRAEPPVAVVPGNAGPAGNEKVAEAYLQYLYSPEGQKIVAKHFYRPAKPELADPADLARLPEVRLVTLKDTFGSWPEVQAKHFANGGIFDQILKPAS